MAARNSSGFQKKKLRVFKQNFQKYGAFVCEYCNRTDLQTEDSSKENFRTIDHVIPLARGGNNSIGNLVVACQSCNGKKGSKFLWETELLEVRL